MVLSIVAIVSVILATKPVMDSVSQQVHVDEVVTKQTQMIPIVIVN